MRSRSLYRFRLSALSIASGLLLAVSFPASGSLTIFSLFALVPLLLVSEIIIRNPTLYRRSVLRNQAFLAFFTFNLASTWWIYNASAVGLVGAIFFNALFQTIVFILFHFVRKNLGEKIGYTSLIFFWVAFEYIHLNWELSYPWLNLGNILAGDVSLAQWYEYTGTLGGTLWILISNVSIMVMLKHWIDGRRPVKGFVLTILILVLPPIISQLLYLRNFEPVRQAEVVVVQPNIDPYYEKFDGLTPEEQLDRMLVLALEKTSDKTDYVILPETALPQGLWEDQLEESPSLKTIREFISQHPNLHFITGLSSYKMYPPGVKGSATARPRQEGQWYDAYNTAIQVDESPPIQIYHKSKLVIGVETTPYPAFFGLFYRFTSDFGGITGSLGVDEEPSVFWSADSLMSLAPVICFESVYGEYVGEYIRKGATMIAIITNDGWWGDTPGYKQHLKIGALRAIEHRRAIARSANTGVSAFIDVRGEIMQPTPYWEEASISQMVSQYDFETVYTRHGDYLGRIASAFSVLLLVWSVAVKLNTTRKRLRL